VSTYTYPQSGVIDEVTFRKTAKGTSRAYLHATESADQATLKKIIEDLLGKDWECISYSENGKSLLEVRGFKRPGELIAELENRQWAQGKSTYRKEKEHINFIDKVRKRSLQASGAVYAWGDISFFLFGLKDSSALNAAAGIFYGLPTPVLLAYGVNDQSEFQIKDIARKMERYFKEQGNALPEQCSLKSITEDHKKGLIGNMNDLFHRYPSEFMNLCYTTAGACIFAAGTKQLKAAKKMPLGAARKNKEIENWLNLGVGVSTVGSGLFGTFVKEKARDPDAPNAHGMKAVWEWVQQRPLAVAGTGLIVSTFLHAAAAKVGLKSENKKHKDAVWLRVSFVVSALLAELLIAISSKGHGSGVKSDNSVDNSVIALAAGYIAKQPKNIRDLLIDRTARFLGHPDILAVKNEDVKKQLYTQVEAMYKNPWATCQSAEEKAPEPELTVAAKIKPADTQSWQARHALEKAQPAQPSLST
jgi:hypothetical protein